MMTKPDRDDEARSRGGWGPAICILGGIMMVVTVLDLPPNFQKLAASEAQVTRVPYIKFKMTLLDYVDVAEKTFSGEWHRIHWRQYEHPALDLDGTSTWIATGFGRHGRPAELADVREGDRVKVWVHEPSREVWQVAYRDKTLLAYEAIASQDSQRRRTFRFVALGVLLIGMVLAVFRF
jgi:hypothetical protein